MSFPLEGLFGSLTGSEDVYGTKPLPVHTPTPDEILQEASLANLGSLDAITKLGAGVNQANLDWNLKAFEEAAPGTGAAREQYLRNITDNLAGVVSPDVADKLKRQGAAWAIGSGTGGAQIGDFRNLRNYGLTSMARQDLGGQQLENYLENIRKYTIPKPFDFSQSFLKPTYDPYADFQNQIYNAKIAAAPTPAAAGAAAAETALLESILSAYSGTPHSAGASYQNPFAGGGGPRTAPYSPNYMSPNTGGWPDSTGLPSESAWA